MSVFSEEVIGGRVNRVVRRGNTVRRVPGPWTPAVHALLEHLEQVGFHGSPRARGRDLVGREILSFIPGDVPAGSTPPYALTEDALAAVGRLIREYHDAASSFSPPHDVQWYLPPREPAEVICHGDLAPYNCVYRDGVPVALIDFDVAHPGPRVWDLGYAAATFVPLQAPDNEHAGALQAQCRRLRLLCDAYGLVGAERPELVDSARARLVHVADHIEARAAEHPETFGQAAFADALAAGVPTMFRASADYIDANAHALKAALES